MAFEYIGHADDVAQQQQLWGVLLLAAGALLAGYVVFKEKSGVYWIGVLALLAAGAYFFYQWMQLKSSGGDWVIQITDNEIVWQSPNETVDSSFELRLNNIAFIDRSAMQGQSDHRPVYHLIPKSGEPIRLNPMSGIDLEAFTQNLFATGIEIKETGQYHLPTELRNK